jgi:hypothetical protein
MKAYQQGSMNFDHCEIFAEFLDKTIVNMLWNKQINGLQKGRKLVARERKDMSYNIRD